MSIVSKILGKWPRVSLFDQPSPVQRLCRLEEAVGDKVEIYAKREDLLRPLCGNKLRYIEFVLGAYEAGNHDSIVHCGGLTSNFLLQLAIVGAQDGIPIHLIVQGKRPAFEQGNLLLERLFGANLRFVDSTAGGTCGELKRAYASELRGQGGNPFVIDYPFSNFIGILGYLDAYQELRSQIGGPHVPGIDHITMCSAGNSYLGMRIGADLFEDPVLVTAFPPVRFTEAGLGHIARDRRAFLIKKIGEFGKAAGTTLDTSDVDFDESFVGKGYGVPTVESMEAVKLVASTEGVLLDPIYTGKAMAGLISYIRKGKIPAGSRVLFMHTGGWVNVFTYNECFADKH